MLCHSASISPVWSSGGDAGAPAGEPGAPTPRLLQDRAVALSPQSLSWPHLITGHAQGADTVLSAPRVFNTSVLQNPVHGVSYPTSQTRMQGERAGRPPGGCHPLPASKALPLPVFLLAPLLLCSSAPPSGVVLHGAPLYFPPLPFLFPPIVSWGRCDKVPHPGRLSRRSSLARSGGKARGQGAGRAGPPPEARGSVRPLALLCWWPRRSNLCLPHARPSLHVSA